MANDKKFWLGKLFTPCFATLDDELEGQSRPDRDPSVVFRIESLPFPDDIERAAEAFPNAEPDLRGWAASWAASFPDWQSGPEAQAELASRLEPDDEPSHGKRIDDAIARFRESPGPDAALTALWIEKSIEHGPVARTVRPDSATLLARTLRSANAFAALVQCPPFTSGIAFISTGKPRELAVLTGFRKDGTAILAKPWIGHGGRTPERDVRVDEGLTTHLCRSFLEETAGLPFWTWKALDGKLGRTVFGTAASHHEIGDRQLDERDSKARDVLVAGALADMYAQRHRVAVLTPRVKNRQEAGKLVFLDGLDTIDAALSFLRKQRDATWAETAEPLDEYLYVNRFFFQGGRMKGRSCIEPTAHPYEAENSAGDDARLSWGVTSLLEGGDMTVASPEAAEAHRAFAEEIAALVCGQGVMDFCLDVGTKSTFHSGCDSEAHEREMHVLAISDLWSANRLGLDASLLVAEVREDRSVWDRKLEDALNRLPSYGDFGRLSADFGEAVSDFGMDAMVARIVQRCAEYHHGSEAAQIDDVILESVAHYVNVVDPSHTTESERDAAYWISVDLRYDGFHEWLSSKR